MVVITETFLLSALTIGSGIIMGIVGVCYKSKCAKFRMCCIDIERNVIVEEHEDLARLTQQPQASRLAKQQSGSPKINTSE